MAYRRDDTSTLNVIKYNNSINDDKTIKFSIKDHSEDVDSNTIKVDSDKESSKQYMLM